MNWKGNPYRHTATDAEGLAHSPSGGAWKIVFLGIILPLIIAYFGIRAWVTEEAIWFGKRNSDIIVRGVTARALAVTYISVGFFCHFRWCWGLIPVYRVFEIGTIASLIGILGGLAYGVFTLFG